MKTILYLHSSSDLYGSDRSLLRTINGLDRTKFIPIVCLPYDGPLVDALRKSEVKVFMFPLAVLRRSFFTPWGLLQFCFQFFNAFFRLAYIVRKEKIVIIHSNTAAVLVGGVVARMLGKTHVWHIREIIIHPKMVKRFLAWMVYHFSSVVVAVSDSVVDHLETDQPKIRGKCRIIHNGLDTDKFENGDRTDVRTSLALKADDILVGMIGRVSHWKGQDLFVSMAKRIIPIHHHVRFVAVGSAFSGQEFRMDEFRKKVMECGLSGRFIIEEFRTDVADLLAAMDIFVLPSILPDPFPATVLEAMAAGKAIVANAHGGVVQMLEDGISGLLVSPNDEELMFGKIDMLIKDSKKRNSLGVAAKDRVNEMFTVKAYCGNMNNLYMEFVKDRPLVKIAIIGSRGYPYVYSGYETFVSELSVRLVGRGHEVFVYCHSQLFDAKPETVNGVHLVYIPAIEKKILSQFSHSFLSTMHVLMKNIDVVLYVNSANGPFGLLTRLFGKRTAINVDGLEWLRPKWKGLGAKYFYFASYLSTKFFDVVISDSDRMADIYREQFNRNSVTIAYGANVAYSSNPELINEFGLIPDGYYLIVGRLIPDNNADLIVRAFERCDSKRKLVVVGDVPYKDDYVDRIRSTKDPRIVFPGYVKDGTVLRELYCNAYAYLHGHEFGGTNPTLLKALAYGCCIIALDTPFNREVLNGKMHGVFFEKNETSAAEQISWIDRDSEKVEALSKVSRDRITQNYTWEKITNQYDALFRQMIIGKP